MKNWLLINVLVLFFLNVNAQRMNDSSKMVATTELTDRIAISDLINNYSRFADRREPEKQADLFITTFTLR